LFPTFTNTWHPTMSRRIPTLARPGKSGPGKGRYALFPEHSTGEADRPLGWRRARGRESESTRRPSRTRLSLRLARAREPDEVQSLVLDCSLPSFSQNSLEFQCRRSCCCSPFWYLFLRFRCGLFPMGTHALVGCLVTLQLRIRHRSCATTKKPYSMPKVSAGTTGTR
jgi:hypothetical protein